MALVLGLNGLQETLAAELHAQSIVCSRIIAHNPDFWRTSPERMEFALGDLHRPERQLIVRLRDGSVLARLGASSPPVPSLSVVRALVDGGNQVGEIELVGSWRPVLLHVFHAGLIGTMLALFVATPLFRRVEASLRQTVGKLNASEMRYRMLFAQAHDGIVLIDPATQRFVEFNQMAHEQLGYTMQEFAQLRIPDFVAAETPAEIATRIARVLRQGWDDFESQHRHKDGRILDFQVILQSSSIDGQTVLMAIFRDISQRKRAEAKLLEAHRLLQTVLDTVPIRVFWKDRHGRYLGCNEGFAHDAGLANAQEIVGRSDAELVWHADAARYQRTDQEVMLSGLPKLAYLDDLTQADGSRMWLRTSKVPLRDSLGAIVGVLGAYDDITQWKKAEDRLKERETTLSAIFAQAGDAIELTDMETLRFVEFNNAGPRMLGYSREEYAALRVVDIACDQSEADIKRLGTMLTLGENAHFQTRHRRKDGSFIDVEIVVSVIQHESRKYWLAVWSDITERLLAQQKLLQQIVFTEAVIEAEFDGVAVSHASGDLPYGFFSVWNRAMTELTGYTAEEINRIGWGEALYDNPADVQRSCQRIELLRQGMHLDGEERVITRKDGQKRTVKLYTKFVSLPGAARHVLLVAHDITEQKRDELEIQELTNTLERRVAERTEQLLAAEHELKALNESLARQVADKVEEIREKDYLLVEQARHAAMGEMIGNIAHQWRQPLSMLSLVIQNLRYDAQEGRLTPADLEMYIAKALRAIEQMTGTIDDFRDFFKPSRQPEFFAPLRQVENCRDLLDPSLRANGIELVVGGTADIMLHGYPGEFSQIILNLIGNAKDALLERRVDNGRIAIEVRARNGRIVVTVTDNAGGIPSAHMEKIFDPYFTTKSKGTGIGLYMTKTIIEQHMHGIIRAENGAAGALFTIELPSTENISAGGQHHE
jgi:PAS domain S-box-containing protein